MQAMQSRMGTTRGEIPQGLSGLPLPLLGFREAGEEVTMPAPKDPVKYLAWIEKNREAHKGKHPSEETRHKTSISLKGRPKSKDHIRKVSEALKGRKLSPLALQKNIESHKNPSEKTREKLRVANLGKHHSEETRRKMSDSHKGPKAYQWRGGISFEPYCPRFTKEFKERVRAFFGYKCVECGTPQNGEKLSIHHVNFNKKTCCDNSVPLFVSLCRNCHTKTNHNRPYWESHFTEIINRDYAGKCYFTKEEMEKL